jgi:hypothetical protein
VTMVRMKAFAGVAALGLLLAFVATAYANSVSFTGQGTKNSRILMGFRLRGQGCPGGSHCLDNAHISKFDGVSYAFPNCPDLLDSAFELNKVVPVRGDNTFRASGTSVEGDDVVVKGRFFRHGKRARGFFKVVIHPTSYGCTSGWVPWAARAD